MCLTATAPAAQGTSTWGTIPERTLRRAWVCLPAVPRTTLRGAYAIFYQGFGQYNQTAGNSIRTAWVGSWLLSADPIQPWRGIFNLDSGFPDGRYVQPKFNPSYGNTSSPVMFDPQYLTMPCVHIGTSISSMKSPGTWCWIGLSWRQGHASPRRFAFQAEPASASLLQKFGTALLNPVRNAEDAAKNGIAYPFAGFSGTVASAQRQYPQVVGNSTISDVGAPLGFSNTHMLQVTVDKRFSKGLTAFANYVWSKTLNNAESGINGVQSSLDYYNLKLEKAVPAYDIRTCSRGILHTNCRAGAIPGSLPRPFSADGRSPRS